MKFATTLAVTCLSTSTFAAALVIPRTHPSLAGASTAVKAINRFTKHTVNAGGGAEAVAEHAGHIANFISTQSQSTQDRRDLALDAPDFAESFEELDARTHPSLAGAAHAVKAMNRFAKHTVNAGGGAEAVAEHAGHIANFISAQSQSTQDRRDLGLDVAEIDARNLDARDFEELDTRDIFEEDIYARDFIENELDARDFYEEVYARDFIVEELDTRDLKEELDARDVLEEELYARYFEEELEGRDFEEELDARSVTLTSH
ncbi:hypothetical protein H0H92_005100 [Tricholoma furcatifolium]|nr:hypothetical protein H0H92_005100 [Tricholoma furcatifolium]